MEKYRFLNANLSEVLQSFFLCSVVLIILFLFLKITWWLAIGGSLLFHLIYLLICVGVAKVQKEGSTKKIIFQDIQNEMVLTLPIELESWWNYTFQDAMSMYGNDAFNGKNSGLNIVNVILKIVDAKQQTLYVLEEIVYDERFPNEVKYSLQEREEGIPVINVQRLDKFVDFLHRNLEPEDYKNNEPKQFTN